MIANYVINLYFQTIITVYYLKSYDFFAYFKKTNIIDFEPYTGH